MHSLRICGHFLALTCFVAGISAPMLHAGKTAAAPGVIPQPARMEIRSGTFAIGPKTRIDLDTSNRDAYWVGEYLSGLLSNALGHSIPVHITNRTGPQHNAIIFSLQGRATLGPEGYELSVSRDAIHISAPKVAGLFYGVETLRQMLPPQIERGAPIDGPLNVHCTRIQDRPRFAWRGLMMDCSRTFLSMDYLRRTVDLMALYKLNVLHLHLTDDQGWRLQMNQYPELTCRGFPLCKALRGWRRFLYATADARARCLCPQAKHHDCAGD